MSEPEAIDGESWRLLPGAEDRYEVSDFGRVRSLTGGSRAGTVRRKRPLLMSPYDNGRGYLAINLKLSGGYECHGIGELVLRAFVGPKPSPTHHAAHGNGRRHDNRLQNLRWATPKENDADKDVHHTRRLRPRRLVAGVEHFLYTRCDTWLARVPPPLPTAAVPDAASVPGAARARMPARARGIGCVFGAVGAG